MFLLSPVITFCIFMCLQSCVYAVSKIICSTWFSLGSISLLVMLHVINYQNIFAIQPYIVYFFYTNHHYKEKQAGAELGQAQLKLGLGFTSTIDSK